MSDVWYWAVLERNKEGRFFAHVPDLPGATAAGDTEQDVLRNIAEIAADHVRDLVEDGHPIPKARNCAEIEHDPEVAEYGRATIPVDLPGQPVKISMSIDSGLLKRIDREANRSGMTRSGFLAVAATDRLRAEVPGIPTPTGKTPVIYQIGGESIGPVITSVPVEGVDFAKLFRSFPQSTVDPEMPRSITRMATPAKKPKRRAKAK